MRVESVHNIIGWFQDKLRVETRRTYHYDKGNDVTVVDRRDINIVLYNKKGKIQEAHKMGSNLDLKT